MLRGASHLFSPVQHLIVATSEVAVQLHAQSISDFSQLCDSHSVGAARRVVVASK